MDRTTPESLRRRFLEMGDRVVDMMDRARRALLHLNEPLALQTIVLDRRVNQDEIEIDAACAALVEAGGLSPADVRLVMAVSKSVTDLERIADLAVNLCELVALLEEQGPPGDAAEIDALAGMVEDMLRGAVDAFRHADATAALAIIARDAEVDARYKVLFLDLLGRLSRRAGPPEMYVPEQHIVKMLERIADHATNVAEQVVYQVHGRDVRHLGKRLG